MEPTEYGLILSFAGLYETEEEEHAFVHGVEFQGIWHRMRSGDEAEFETVAHLKNRTVIERAAASQGWELSCQDTHDGCWMMVRLSKVRKARDGNPHGLRVVGAEA